MSTAILTAIRNAPARWSVSRHTVSLCDARVQAAVLGVDMDAFDAELRAMCKTGAAQLIRGEHCYAAPHEIAAELDGCLFVSVG